MFLIEPWIQLWKEGQKYIGQNAMGVDKFVIVLSFSMKILKKYFSMKLPEKVFFSFFLESKGRGQIIQREGAFYRHASPIDATW